MQYEDLFKKLTNLQELGIYEFIGRLWGRYEAMLNSQNKFDKRMAEVFFENAEDIFNKMQR